MHTHAGGREAQNDLTFLTVQLHRSALGFVIVVGTHEILHVESLRGVGCRDEDLSFIVLTFDDVVTLLDNACLHRFELEVG